MGASDLPRCFNFTGTTAEIAVPAQLVHLLLKVCEKCALRVMRVSRLQDECDERRGVLSPLIPGSYSRLDPRLSAPATGVWKLHNPPDSLSFSLLSFKSPSVLVFIKITHLSTANHGTEREETQGLCSQPGSIPQMLKDFPS